MCCFVLLLAGFGPRIAIVAIWLFGDRVDHAFGSWVWPLLGVLVAPWTTLAYLVVWSPVGGVSGWEWILVGLGVALDVASYVAKPVQRRYATA